MIAGRLVSPSDPIAAGRLQIGSIKDGQWRVEDQRVLENALGGRRGRLRWPGDLCLRVAHVCREDIVGQVQSGGLFDGHWLAPLIWCHGGDGSQYVANVADGDIGLSVVAQLARRADWVSDALNGVGVPSEELPAAEKNSLNFVRLLAPTFLCSIY